MKEHRRVSQIVNNFFTLASIVMITIVISLYSKYGSNIKEKPRLNSQLPCQKETYTFDKISSYKLIQNANSYLEKGSFVINGGFIKPRFGKFYLKDKISLEEANDYFQTAINVNQKKELVKYLTIKYEIIENDKNDPRKKDYQKINAGELLSSFRINGKELFMMKTEFMEYDKLSIKNRIECTIKAFKHNAK